MSSPFNYPSETNWPHRTYCDALHEMRNVLKSVGLMEMYDTIDQIATTKLNETGAYSILGSLIEELQVYGNRMESALGYTNDLKTLHDNRKKLTEEIRDLEEELKYLQAKKDRK